MNCGYSEIDIALYVEDDLAREKCFEIETHLASCDYCREIVEELRESQFVFKSMRAEMVSGAALAAVRTRVLAEIGASRVKPAWGRWIYAMAGAAFVVVLAVMQLRVSVPLPIAPPPAVPITKADKPAMTATTRPEGRDHQDEARTKVRSPRRVDSPKPIATEPKQLVVKLLTDDPTVVIYWLVDDPNGGTS